MMLALLLARRGVAVTLLEAHADFDRDFRGDTVHPAILEVLDQIGLAEALHEVPHVKFFGPSLVTDDGLQPLFDFRRLRTKFPWVMLVPQERFIAFLAGEAAKYPRFRLVMKARVTQLIEENGRVCGVRYQEGDAWREVRAPLTVGADGRFSRVRHLAGIVPDVLAPPMELLWFRLPRLPSDAAEFATLDGVRRGRALAVMNGEPGPFVAFIYRGQGFLLGLIDRIDHWQVAYIYPEGTYQALKAAGVDAFRRSIAELEPRLASHVEHLTDWRELSPLSVAFSRCRQWYKPGLLLIGDAAHVMTPAAGAGIKYAIEDAVVAANVLAKPLSSGSVTVADLAKVQRKRERPTRLMQRVGAAGQQALARLLREPPARRPSRAPWLLRLFFRTPGLRSLPALFVGFGFWRVRVEE